MKTRTMPSLILSPFCYILHTFAVTWYWAGKKKAQHILYSLFFHMILNLKRCAFCCICQLRGFDSICFSLFWKGLPLTVNNIRLITSISTVIHFLFYFFLTKGLGHSCGWLECCTTSSDFEVGCLPFKWLKYFD